jgi:hypothetical protein
MENDHSFGGIPIVISPYAEKGRIYLIPDPRSDDVKPLIISDSFQTIKDKVEAFFAAQDKAWLKCCGVIYNIGEK